MSSLAKLLLPLLVALGSVLTGCSVGTPEPAAAGAAGDREAILAHRPELEMPRTEDYDYDPPEPGTYALPVIEEAADGRVLGPDGSSSRLRRLMDGRITILSFIYTRCGDPRACPRASGVLYGLQRASRQDPVIGENLRLVTMSFDPDFDTPDRMAAYGRGLKPGEEGAEWLFLTTRSSRDLQPILEAYGQQVVAKKDPNDAMGPLSHTIRVYLIDRQGRIRNIYSFGLMDPRVLLTDVRTLLLEELGERA
jgi:protein SCO1